ncbi:MAG TPA: YciI family protein [Streptosporangiaceae bacterium]
MPDTRLASGRTSRLSDALTRGLVIFDAPDEQAARQVMEEDPVVRGGYALGEVRPFRVSLLRGRD